MVKKVDDMFSCFDTIPTCDDRQTDILLQHSPRYAYALRYNKIL